MRAESLRAISAFGALDDKSLADLAGCFRTRSLKAGETLSGADGEGLFVVVEGTVALNTDGPYNTRLRKALVGEGGYFGEGFLAGSGSAHPVIEPLTDATLLVLPATVLQDVQGLGDAVAASLAAHENQLTQVNDFGETRINLLAGHTGEPILPTTFVDFAENSREYHLSTIQTVLQTHTRITDLYSTSWTSFASRCASPSKR